jgi:hypothetical protein
MPLSIPAAIATSTGLTDDARTRTSSSFAPGSGVDSSLRVGLLSKSCRTTALISVLLSEMLGSSLARDVVGRTNHLIPLDPPTDYKDAKEWR